MLYPTGPISPVTVDQWLTGGDGKVWNTHIFVYTIYSKLLLGRQS